MIQICQPHHFGAALLFLFVKFCIANGDCRLTGDEHQQVEVVRAKRIGVHLPRFQRADEFSAGHERYAQIGLNAKHLTIR